jgi:hypothetical protein
VSPNPFLTDTKKIPREAQNILVCDGDVELARTSWIGCRGDGRSARDPALADVALARAAIQGDGLGNSRPQVAEAKIIGPAPGLAI